MGALDVGKYWSYLTNEKDTWRYFINKHGWRFGCILPRCNGGFFIYFSNDNIYKVDAGDLFSSLESSSKHRDHFDRLLKERPIDVIDGQWTDWELESNSSNRIVFSKLGTQRLALLEDRVYVFGVSIIPRVVINSNHLDRKRLSAGQQGPRLRS